MMGVVFAFTNSRIPSASDATWVHYAAGSQTSHVRVGAGETKQGYAGIFDII